MRQVTTVVLYTNADVHELHADSRRIIVARSLRCFIETAELIKRVCRRGFFDLSYTQYAVL